MLKRTFLTLIVSLTMATLSAFEVDHLNTVTIVNNTGAEIRHLFISPGDSNDWGIELLGADITIDEGSSRSFYLLYPDYENYFDMMAIDVNDNTFTIFDELISDDGEVTVIFNQNALDSDSEMEFAEITIKNTSDEEMEYVFMSRTDSTMWGVDFLGEQQNLAVNGTLTKLVPILDNPSDYDIMTIDRYSNEFVSSFTVNTNRRDQNTPYTHLIRDSDLDGNAWDDDDDWGESIGQTSSLSGFDPDTLNKITLTNKTGAEIEYIFISPADSSIWGMELLGSHRTLENNHHLSFYILYPDYANEFDIMAVDEEGNSFTIFNSLISDEEEAYIDFNKSMINNDMESQDYVAVEIVNGTAEEMQYIFISPSDSAMWGVDFMDEDQTLGAYDSLSLLVPILDDVSGYDLMAIDYDNDEYHLSFDIDYNVDIDEYTVFTYTIDYSDLASDEDSWDDGYEENIRRSTRPRRGDY